MKKQLLLEELKRQGKAPKQRLWILLGLIMVVLVAAGAYWYQEPTNETRRTFPAGPFFQAGNQV